MYVWQGLDPHGMWCEYSVAEMVLKESIHSVLSEAPGVSMKF